MGRYNPETWNYERPINAWESMPWQFRWLAAIAATVYFGGGFFLGFAALLT